MTTEMQTILVLSKYLYLQIDQSVHDFNVMNDCDRLVMHN